jgi:hypothetical protein
VACTTVRPPARLPSSLSKARSHTGRSRWLQTHRSANRIQQSACLHAWFLTDTPPPAELDADVRRLIKRVRKVLKRHAVGAQHTFVAGALPADAPDVALLFQIPVAANEVKGQGGQGAAVKAMNNAVRVHHCQLPISTHAATSR